MVEFSDVTFGFFSVRGCRFSFRGRRHDFNISQVSAIRQINDSHDRRRRQQGIKAGGVRHLRGDAGGGCSRKIGNRSPEIVLRPGVPDRVT